MSLIGQGRAGQGRAGRVLWVLCGVLVLVWHSVRVAYQSHKRVLKGLLHRLRVGLSGF